MLHPMLISRHDYPVRLRSITSRTHAIERGSAIGAARERTADLGDRIETLRHRLDGAVAASDDKPVAFSAAQFGSLAAQVASAGLVRRQDG
jgi:hypothetical protein